MPNYFIVVTNTEMPRLYLSQKPYEETLRALRAWPYSHTKRSFIYVPQALPSSGANPDGDPAGCVQLMLHARIDQDNPVESYQYLWGNAIDELPEEQALYQLQLARDYLERIRVRVEGRNKLVVPDLKATDQSTGP